MNFGKPLEESKFNKAGEEFTKNQKQDGKYVRLGNTGMQDIESLNASIDEMQSKRDNLNLSTRPKTHSKKRKFNQLLDEAPQTSMTTKKIPTSGDEVMQSIYSQQPKNPDTPLKGTSAQLDSMTLNSAKKNGQQSSFQYQTPTQKTLDEEDAAVMQKSLVIAEAGKNYISDEWKTLISDWKIWIMWREGGNKE